MVASSQLDALCDNSVTNVRQSANIASGALIGEAVGTALVAFGALAFHSLGLVAVCLIAGTLLARASDARGNPLVALFCIDDTVSPDDAVRVALVQLGAASVAGLCAGLLGLQIDVARAGPAAEAFVSACVVASALIMRSRGAPAFVGVTATAALGTSCLGNPAVTIGWAVASATRGSLVGIGALLGAQLVGAILGALLASLRADAPIAPIHGV